MDLKDYHKEELQILLLTLMKHYASKEHPDTYKGQILKAWIDRIRLALKDK